MMKHPVRKLFEYLGLVRDQDEQEQRFAEADRVAEDGLKAAREAKIRRERLADEAWRRNH